MRSTIVWMLILVVAGIGPAAAAGREADSAQDEATAEKQTAPSIPDAEKKRPNPVPRSKESVEHGSLLFSSQCAMCHGANGKGGGAMAERLGISVPDFTAPGRLSERTDGELYYIITRGCGKMPGDGERLEPSWRWDMVNAIRVISGS